MTESDQNLDHPEDTTPTPNYQLANLTMVGAHPWFSVHSTNEHGHTSSWIMSTRFENNQFSVQLQIWVPDAIQALVGDEKGYVWAVTVEGDLITNYPVNAQSGWTTIEPHPHIQQPCEWHMRRLTFKLPSGAKSELVGCLRWFDGDLFIGTFSRRVYRLEEGGAVLERSAHVPGQLGGINDMTVTDHALFAVGYGGTVLRRDLQGQWLALQGPWPEAGAPFINVISAIRGPKDELWAIVAGGAVIASEGDVLHPLYSLPAEPLGITGFQGEWYVSTLGGCYQLRGDGQAVLIKSDIVMGKALDAGVALIAFDAAPEQTGTAAIHVWLRTRTIDRWLTQVICRA